MHIRLKFECWVVFGLLSAEATELPKESSDITTGIQRGADSLAPIYSEFVMPKRRVFLWIGQRLMIMWITRTLWNQWK